jgi:ATP synthase protein I
MVKNLKNNNFSDIINIKANRKIKARLKSKQGVWFGLGMIGLVGWSVIVPTLLGTALGTWLDAHYPSRHALTLPLLILGLFIGCMNAWYWVKKEEIAMDRRDSDE